jgi:hypothetical protein
MPSEGGGFCLSGSPDPFYVSVMKIATNKRDEHSFWGKIFEHFERKAMWGFWDN